MPHEGEDRDGYDAAEAKERQSASEPPGARKGAWDRPLPHSSQKDPTLVSDLWPPEQ